MFTQQEYFYGWVFYGIAALIGFASWWFMTTKMSKDLRQVLRLFVAVILIVPWYADPALDFLAPAWVIAIVEGLFDGMDAFWRAGTPLVFALLVTFCIALGIRIASLLWQRKKRIRQKSAVPES